MKILLSAVLVFAATASIAQDFSDPRYAPWGDTPEQRKQNILTSNLLKEGLSIPAITTQPLFISVRLHRRLLRLSKRPLFGGTGLFEQGATRTRPE
ncbi:MAG: hypothetical protein ACLURY_02915 [Alistipes putredinis]